MITIGISKNTMIEKIKSPLDLKVGNYKGTEFDIIPADTFAMVCRKINEIIDLLNAIVVDVDGTNNTILIQETKGE